MRQVVCDLVKSAHQVVRIQLNEWKEQQVFDVRIWYRNQAGILCPTEKGTMLAIFRLPEFRMRIGELEDCARKAGLIQRPGQ